MAPEQRDDAWLLLQALVTSKKQRALRTRDQLIDDLRLQGVEPATTDVLLKQLVDSFLVRVDEIGEHRDMIAYELAHDYLLEEFELDEATQARKAAQELLDRELAVIALVSLLALATASQTHIVPVGEEPVSLAWDGTALWVSIPGQKALKRIDPESGAVIGSVPLDGADYALLWTGSDLWAAGLTDGKIYQIDIARQEVRSTIDLGSGQLIIALAWDGANLWAAFPLQNQIKQIDPVDGAIVQTLTVGPAPAGLAWDGTTLWVTNAGEDSVQQIDTARGSVVAAIKAGVDPISLAWDGSGLWVANDGDYTITRIDPASAQTV